MNSIPLPKPDEVFSAVKSSCCECCKRAGLNIEKAAIHSFLTDLNEQEDQWTQLSVNHGTKVSIPQLTANLIVTVKIR